MADDRAKNKKNGVIDKNGRIFGRMSIVDFFVIVLLIGIAAATVYRFTAQGMTAETTGRLSYTIKISGVREFTNEYYEEGLRCYDKDKDAFIGTVKSVSIEPVKVPMTKLDGSIVEAVQPGRIVVFLEIEAEYSETNSAYFLYGSYELKTGSQVHLNTKYTDVVATVVSINK